MERLNNSVRNGAISSATSFITETGSGSAAELLSGRRDIAETMSSAVTEVKDTSDVPSGTREKTGSGSPSVLDRTALTFSEKKRLNSSTEMHELVGGRPRPSSWLTDLYSFLGDSRPRSTVSHQNAPRFIWQRSRSLSVPGSPGIVNTSRRTGVVLCSLPPTCRRVRRLASKQSLSNQGFDDRGRRVTTRNGIRSFSTEFSSESYKAAISSMSSGHLTG